ncbi:glutathione peroxidase [uncultured Aliiroseovarius sp.]|uniref:glutathione peroxidase n=1 Tax=uncultured Aliiroseovarius sp. TaxID=1658783 RepID=UPI0025947AC5|nr:glutathione peroxidase [uncultured Aliiroseovarius sp.]
MLRLLIVCLAVMFGSQARAVDLATPFAAIDGGSLSISQWRGQPVLVVNTASRCVFAKQFDGMQTLYDTYRDRGLVVLAVPSNDFRQELATDKAVKEYCEMRFGIDMPMAGITTIIGPDAHAFYRSLKAETGFSPAWNFTKVLIGPDGKVIATYGPPVKPMSATITKDIEAALLRATETGSKVN